MTIQRLRNRTFSSRFTIAVGAPALALAALAASGSLSATAAAQPVGQARQAAIGRAVPRTAAAGRVTLTSFVRRAGGAGEAGAFTVAQVATSHRLTVNEAVAWKMMYNDFNWLPRSQFRFLRWLWMRESSWNVYASNPYTGAYGIPQATPGYKMSSAGPRWQSSAATQIRWGMRYIKERYGSPRNAWDHEIAYGWY